MTRTTDAAKDAHRYYMRAYMAEQRLKNPKSQPDKMRAGYREILGLLGDPTGATGKRIKEIAASFLNPPKTPIKDTGDEDASV